VLSTNIFKEYLSLIKYFFMHSLPGNFLLFLDITKSVFKSSMLPAIFIYPPQQKCLIVK